MPVFPPEVLREVLGLYPTGITVVTAKAAGGEHYGVTVNSFSPVSLDPPLVLFSLSRKLPTLGALLAAQAFAIHFLRDDQKHISARFARPQSNKWDGVACREGITGSPVLEASLAVLECELYAQYDGGDHVIVLGRIVHLEKDAGCHALVFYRSRYHTVGCEAQ